MVKSQQICLAVTEQRRHTAHSHNEQGAGETQGAVDPSSVPRIGHGLETAQDGNISYEFLLVLHSVKKIIMALRTLVPAKETYHHLWEKSYPTSHLTSPILSKMMHCQAR